MACRTRSTCRGTLKLRRGRTVVARRAVRVRGRRTKTLRFRLAPQATTAAAGRAQARLRAARLRGARITIAGHDH